MERGPANSTIVGSSRKRGALHGLDPQPKRVLLEEDQITQEEPREQNREAFTDFQLEMESQSQTLSQLVITE